MYSTYLLIGLYLLKLKKKKRPSESFLSPINVSLYSVFSVNRTQLGLSELSLAS